MKAHLIERLKALARAQGGPEAVAEASGVSAENLKQIISGTKLPSGQPRGVGPGLQAKLDKAFPGWAQIAAAAAPPVRSQPPTIAQAVEILATALAAEMRDEVREDVADALAKLARRKGSGHDRLQVLHLLALPLPPQVAAALSGDPGNEAAAVQPPADAAPNQAPAKRSGRHTATGRPTQP